MGSERIVEMSHNAMAIVSALPDRQLWPSNAIAYWNCNAIPRLECMAAHVSIVCRLQKCALSRNVTITSDFGLGLEDNIAELHRLGPVSLSRGPVWSTVNPERILHAERWGEVFRRASKAPPRQSSHLKASILHTPLPLSRCWFCS